jgi:hypothetical protein
VAAPPVASPPFCAYTLKKDKELNRSKDATQTATIKDVLDVLVDRLYVSDRLNLGVELIKTIAIIICYMHKNLIAHYWPVYPFEDIPITNTLQ